MYDEEPKEEVNPFANPPVYKADQVITVYDLEATICDLEMFYSTLSPFQWLQQYRTACYIELLYVLMSYLDNHKTLRPFKDNPQ